MKGAVGRGMGGVGGGKERCVGSEEVWESVPVWGEWGSVMACG